MILQILQENQSVSDNPLFLVELSKTFAGLSNVLAPGAFV